MHIRFHIRPIAIASELFQNFHWQVKKQIWDWFRLRYKVNTNVALSHPHYEQNDFFFFLEIKIEKE